MKFTLRFGKKTENFQTNQLQYLKLLIEKSLGESNLSLKEAKLITTSLETNQVISTICDVSLKEVRAGTSISNTAGSISARTSSASMGISTKHIGVSGSVGSINGSMRSTTITPPSPELLLEIDSGKIVLRQDLIAFVGSKYSRTFEYKNVLDWVCSSSKIPFNNQFTLSVKDSDKVLVFIFKLSCQSEFLSQLIFETLTSKEQIVDSSVANRILPLINNDISLRMKEIQFIEKTLVEGINIEKTWGDYVSSEGRLDIL